MPLITHLDPTEYNEPQLPFAEWRKYSRQLDDLCQCGHTRNAHNGKLMHGYCWLNPGRICTCRRWKLAKPIPLVVTDLPNVESVEPNVQHYY